MTDLRTAAQQALEALGLWASGQDMGAVALNDLIHRLEAALAKPEPETCTWWQDGDSDSGTYQTSCGNYFAITDGTPEDNKMRHCCYCGKKLVQELITEDDDE